MRTLQNTFRIQVLKEEKVFEIKSDSELTFEIFDILSEIQEFSWNVIGLTLGGGKSVISKKFWSSVTFALVCVVVHSSHFP